MTYTITLPNLSTIQVQQGSIDTTSTSLTLVGKNVPNWGQYYTQNFVDLLANFEAAASPTSPVNGQIWWDSANQILKVFNGTVFKSVTNVQSSVAAPNNVVQGDLWWNSSLKYLSIYDSGLWSQVGAYVLPAATSGTLGGIKSGLGFGINTDGTLNLAPATNTNLGGVKVGNGLTIDNVGNLSVNSLPVTTTNSLGLVQIGSGLSVDSNGVISVSYRYTLPQSSNTVLGGIQLGTGFIVNGQQTSVDYSHTVLKTGSTMTGALILSADPTTSAQAATKNYVDTVLSNGLAGVPSNYLLIAGGTLLGALILEADPMVNLGAATKQYVDNSISALTSILNGDLVGYLQKAGGTMTGSLVLNADPSINLGAATKQYVDNSITNAINNLGNLHNLPGRWTLINTLVANGSSTLTDTTSFTTNYTQYMIVISDIIPGSANESLAALVQVGGVFLTSGYQTTMGLMDAHGEVGGGSAYNGGIYFGGDGRLDTTTGLNGEMRINNPLRTNLYKLFYGITAHHDTVYGAPSIMNIASSYTGSFDAITGLQFFMTSGNNIASGTIKIFGAN